MTLNLSTENLARESASHPWRVVWIWLFVVVGSIFMITNFLEEGLTTKFEFVNNPEVKKGENLLEQMKGPKGTNEVIVFQSSKFTVDDSEYKRVVEGLEAELVALGPEFIRLETLDNFYNTGAPPFVSDDRTATLMGFVMAGDFDTNSKNIAAVVELVHETAFEEADDFDIKIAGQATIGLDNREITQEDLEKGEAFGIPIALLILMVVLGAIFVAMVPLVMAIVSIVLAVGLAAVVGTFFELSLFVTNIITMIGLAVGIDYSLFVLTRYREERSQGLDKVEAISKAGATASRAVVFSGMTVVLALVGMVFIPFNIFISIGLGAIFVVVAAMAAAMTLLPAMLIFFDRLADWYRSLADEPGKWRCELLTIRFLWIPTGNGLNPILSMVLHPLRIVRALVAKSFFLVSLVVFFSPFTVSLSINLVMGLLSRFALSWSLGENNRQQGVIIAAKVISLIVMAPILVAIIILLAVVLGIWILIKCMLNMPFGQTNYLRWISDVGVGKFEGTQTYTASGGFWDWLVQQVTTRPLVSLLVTAGLLVAATVPFFSIHTGFAGISTFPDELESKQAFLVLDEKFSFGEVTPAEIVISGNIASAEVQGGIESLKVLMANDNAFGQPRDVEVSEDGRIALLAVPVSGDSSGDTSIGAVTRLRDRYVPSAFVGVNADIFITGETAFNMAFFSVSKDSAWIVFPFVLGISFLLLLVVFRSLILPIKAIILNLLAVGAAYGLIVLVFQKGFMTGAFGFEESPTVESWIPLFLFSILFGLSMDYHVFLLSRIRERYDQTKNNDEAVSFGVRSTGRLITGAGLIMVAVFWGFATGSMVGMQQMGFGLGVAILIDASIIRIVMVPAAMKILGDWNWYLPRWLNWLPDFRVEPVDLKTPPGIVNN